MPKRKTVEAGAENYLLPDSALAGGLETIFRIAAPKGPCGRDGLVSGRHWYSRHGPAYDALGDAQQSRGEIVLEYLGFTVH